MTKNFLTFSIICFLFSFSLSSFAASAGFIMKVQGSAELLLNPAGKKMKGAKTVSYMGKIYQIKKAKRGMKVSNGDILRTGDKSKVKIVYKNGDQFNVGQGTEFKVHWEKTKVEKKDSTTVDLIRGSLRGIISKKGPRSGMKVKSRNAVMGVRGTDFHFNQQGTSGHASIAVLRGEVEVFEPKKEKKPYQVKQGFSAEVTTLLQKELTAPPITKVELSKTTKQEIIHIQKNSQIKTSKKEKPIKDKKLAENLKQLEKKAIEVTLDDIKEYQPAVYQEIKKEKLTSIDTINTQVLSKAFKKAPKRKAKKGFDELEIKVEDDAYEKYFKVE